MRHHFIGCLALGMGILFVSSAHAQVPGLFNTGVDASGSPLPDDTIDDPHYTLGTNPASATTERVRRGSGGFPIGPWLGDDALSAWIGPNTGAHDLDSAAGLYPYAIAFNVPAGFVSSANITGQWAVDDGDAVNDIIQLNGVTVATGNGGFSSWTPFTIPAGSNFLAGDNTLTFIGSNGGGPGGIRVEFLSGAIPEPTSFSVLGLAMAGFLARRRSR